MQGKGPNGRPSVAVTYSIHKLKILVVENAPRAIRWQPVIKAPCEIWYRSRVNWMQFKEVIVVLLDKGVDASKAGKSFEDWADLFVIVSKLIEISESAIAIEDDLSPLKSLKHISKLEA